MMQQNDTRLMTNFETKKNNVKVCYLNICVKIELTFCDKDIGTTNLQII